MPGGRVVPARCVELERERTGGRILEAVSVVAKRNISSGCVGIAGGIGI